MNKTQNEKVGELAGTVSAARIGPDIFIDDFTAYVHRADEGGFWAEVPALPGCLTQGETLDEVVENLNDAISGWLSVQTLESLTAQGVRYRRQPAAKGAASSRRTPVIRTLEFAV